MCSWSWEGSGGGAGLKNAAYQYVPAPCDVRSMPSGEDDSSSIILLRPKSVILISPLTDVLPDKDGAEI